MESLEAFQLLKDDLLSPGGGRSPNSMKFDGLLHERGWQERSFEAHLVIDNRPRTTVTHKVDNYKNHVGSRSNGTIRAHFTIAI